MKDTTMFKIATIYRILITIVFTLFAQSYAIGDEALNTKDTSCNVASAFNIRFIKDTNVAANNILYLKINHFCTTATQDIGILVRAFFAENPENCSGIVLDLRDTKYGQINHISGVSSLFFEPNVFLDFAIDDKGTSFAIKSGRDYYQKADIVEDFLHDIPHVLKTKPLIALVNAESTHVAQFIAAALLKTNRAVLIGEEFQKGVSHNLTPSDAFYCEVIKLFPVSQTTSLNNPKGIKGYLAVAEFNPEGCSQQQTLAWRKSISDTIRQNVSYPKTAQMRGWEGVGLVGLSVNTKGQATNVKIIGSTGWKILDDAMLTAVATAKLQPLDCATEMKALSIGVPFVFKLLDEVKPENSNVVK